MECEKTKTMVVNTCKNPYFY